MRPIFKEVVGDQFVDVDCLVRVACVSNVPLILTLH